MGNQTLHSPAHRRPNTGGQELAPQLMVIQLRPIPLKLQTMVTVHIQDRVNSNTILLPPNQLHRTRVSQAGTTPMARSIALLLANTLRLRAQATQNSKIMAVKVGRTTGSIRHRLSTVLMDSKVVTEARGLHLRLVGVHDLLILKGTQRTKHSHLA